MAGLPGKTVALGNPQSSIHQISQVELADWMTEIEGLTGLSGFAFVRGSAAALGGLGADGDYALVVTTVAERGIYQRASGSWSKVSDLPLILTESLAADQAEADRILAQAAAVSAGNDADAAAASATAAASSQSLADVARTQAQLAAVAAGATIYASVAAGEAGTVNGDVFLVSTEPGVQVYENDTGTGSFLGWLGEVLLDDVAAVLAWNPPAYPQTGLVLRTRREGFAYSVLASGASDEDLTTAGAVKLRAMQTESGDINVKALGAAGTGLVDDGPAIEKAILAARRYAVNVQYSDGGNPLAFTNTVPAVLFPSGEYRVENAIDVTGLVYVHLKALGKAFIQGSRVTERSVGFLTAGSAAADGNLRYLVCEGLQFQNFDEMISANTSNLDMSRWLFRYCQFDAINLVINSHTYARSRSTICTFDECIFQYRVERIARVFFDKLNFTNCWIGSGSGTTDLITANSLVKIDGCMLVPSGTTSTGKSVVRLIDNDGTGTTVTNEAMRGVHIISTRASNEGGQGPLVVCDYAVQNVDRDISPSIHIDTCALVGFFPTTYNAADSEVGIVHLLKWPASIGFSKCSFRSLGAATGSLVSKAASLTSDAPPGFVVDVDDATYFNGQRAVGEGAGRTIAKSLRGYIRNPAPHNLRGSDMWEDGHIPVVATATTGRKKATFFLRSGFVSALARHTPLVFDLFLGGQGVTNAPDSFLYAGTSTYRLTISGANNAGNQVKLKVEKLSGDVWGATDTANCDIVSAHFGTADTGAATSALLTENHVTIVFGTNVLLGRARLVPAFSKLHRFGDALTG